MNKQDINFKKIPDAPGVYFFLDAKGAVLYVGKATSLRDRVRSYFDPNIAEIRSPLIEKAVRDASVFRYEETDSVLEALMLEAKLIKKHMPTGNSSQKDNKSWNYLVITNEPLPRVMVVRERELNVRFPSKTRKSLFGPFVSGSSLREALKIIRRIFPFFDTPFPLADAYSTAQEKTIQFNQSIGMYPQDFNRTQYQKTIRAIQDIFSANKKGLVVRLEKEMHAAAKKHDFEKAGVLKRTVFALKHIQDVTLVKEHLREPHAASFRIEAYDTAHLRGESPRAVMVVIENGEPVKNAYRLFTIRAAQAGDDYAALEEVLERRAAHREWPLPHLVVIDGGRAHLARAKKTLERLGVVVHIVSVVKDERHRPREIIGSAAFIHSHETAILLANNEAHRFAIGKHRRALRKRRT